MGVLYAQVKGLRRPHRIGRGGGLGALPLSARSLRQWDCLHIDLGTTSAGSLGGAKGALDFKSRMPDVKLKAISRFEGSQ